jgi:hypothetical protein
MSIKGVSSETKDLEFYFFAFSPDNQVDLGIPRYVPEVGQRRVYFLSPWENTFRSVGDVTDYSLPVRTGSPSRQSCNDQEPGCCIAEVLLTPKPDAEIAACGS